jgi:hypothetical protein
MSTFGHMNRFNGMTVEQRRAKAADIIVNGKYKRHAQAPRPHRVTEHLDHNQCDVAALLLEPYDLDKVAERLSARSLDAGNGVTTYRMVEHLWRSIREDCYLTAEYGITSSPAARIALARMVWGLDPCWCER